jgi:hypothetical protein
VASFQKRSIHGSAASGVVEAEVRVDLRRQPLAALAVVLDRALAGGQERQRAGGIAEVAGRQAEVELAAGAQARLDVGQRQQLLQAGGRGRRRAGPLRRHAGVQQRERLDRVAGVRVGDGRELLGVAAVAQELLAHGQEPLPRRRVAGGRHLRHQRAPGRLGARGDDQDQRQRQRARDPPGGA